jgi:hypothetical protein
MLSLDFSGITLKLKQEEGKPYVWDPVRKIWVVLTPEEHVRQYLLLYFTDVMQYPASLIAVEKNIRVGNLSKRFDIVVYSREHTPWLLAECKAPDVPLTEKALHQLLTYHNTMQCNYWLVSNGHSAFCADATDIHQIKWLSELPGYQGIV